ncbi:MAG: hypothetical protein ACRDK9_03190 [Solirubrobacterales bacterium]
MWSRREREREDALGLFIGALAVAAFFVWVAPQALAAIPGWVVGAGYPWQRPDDSDERRHWRTVGAWLLVAGTALAAAYFLLAGRLGADRELRRFSRQWDGFSDAAWQTLAAHPWGWLPLSCAAALGAWGLALVWRSR